MTTGNSSSYFTSDSAFLILTVLDNGLDGVLFDDGLNNTPLYDSFNVIFII